MASTGLGKGLGALLAESAQQPVRTLSEPQRFNGGGQGPELAKTVAPAKSPKIEQQTVDNKWIINRRVLLVADLLLLGIGGWLIAASPMAHTTAALAVGVVLLLIGCVLGCVAMLSQGSSN